MALDRFTDDLHIIENLGDNPKRDNGLSTPQFKSCFDKAGLLIQKYINEKLIPAIENTTPGLYSVSMQVTSCTLKVSGWSGKSQTVAVGKVISDTNRQAVITTASPESLATYLDYNIRLVSQNEGSLTFECDDVPSRSVYVNVLLLTNGG